MPATIELRQRHELWFAPGDPVRAASAVVGWRDGWLVAQDDAVHVAWWSPEKRRATRLRVFPSTGGRDVFDEASGTKHLKPDLEAGCHVRIDGSPAALFLGSGSLPQRTRAALIAEADGRVRSADLPMLYDRVRALLPLGEAALNLEGACVVGERLRWFQRGLARAGVPSMSVDVDLAELLDAIADGGAGVDVGVDAVRTYVLPEVGGLPLAITDAVVLGDGRILVSATAEDAPDAIADGPVLGSALAVLDGDQVTVLRLPEEAQRSKLEGLALLGDTADTVTVLAVTDEDDPAVASAALELTVRGLGTGW